MAETYRGTIYVDGEWQRSAGHGDIEITAAATGSVIGSVPTGHADDVDRAVRAARTAFESWSVTDLSTRLELLGRFTKELEERGDELAELISTEVGTPIKVSKMVQVGTPLRVLRSFPDLLQGMPFEERVGESLVISEPIGVVAAITAWNFPLQQVVDKAAAALATGCTVVCKPSEVAPLTAFVVADILHQIGLPPGVFNLVTGTGAAVGEPLVAHEGVDMVTFTGSTAVGRRVGAVAAETVKKVTLELGGKSANVVLDDADLAQAVKVGIANCFTNSGQTCTALTRMLVPQDRLLETEDLVRERLRRYRLGDPLDPDTTLGPLATAAQRDRVLAYIRRGIQEGAVLIEGGVEPPEGVPGGYFVRPTAFRARPEMSVAAEEVFGPVLSVIPYDSEDDAVRIANDSIYGLAGAVWSGDPDRALRVARRLRTGAVDINGSYFNPLAPFGGYRQSGTGRELGTHGLAEFFELKSVQRPVSG
jgi:acyl-CoA reductase-like NAD-dependent aldehyde dehydrogenase